MGNTAQLKAMNEIHNLIKSKPIFTGAIISSSLPEQGEENKIYCMNDGRIFAYIDNEYQRLDYEQKLNYEQKKNRKIIRTNCQFCGAKLKIYNDEDTCKCDWCDQVNIIAEYE